MNAALEEVGLGGARLGAGEEGRGGEEGPGPRRRGRNSRDDRRRGVWRDGHAEAASVEARKRLAGVAAAAPGGRQEVSAEVSAEARRQEERRQEERRQEEEALRLAESALEPERGGEGLKEELSLLGREAEGRGAVAGSEGPRGGGGAQVDTVLEEAVQALPEELPFQQVDRIEYMNEQRRKQRAALREAAAALGPGREARDGGAATARRSRAHAYASSAPRSRPASAPADAASSDDAAARGAQHRAAASTAEAARGRAEAPATFNLTVVTQTDVSRLSYLAESARRWSGPLVAGVLLPPGVAPADAMGGVTLPSSATVVTLSATGGNAPYPINVLRNRAIREVRTTHYVVLDVDLWPSASLRDEVLSLPTALLARKYAAIVLPAFQLDLRPPPGATAASTARFFAASFGRCASCARAAACMHVLFLCKARLAAHAHARRGRLDLRGAGVHSARRSQSALGTQPRRRARQGTDPPSLPTAPSLPSPVTRVPADKRGLRGCIDEGRCTTFYKRSSPETHSSTPYDEWWTAEAGAAAIPIPCFKSARYEPYVVLPNLPST